MSHEIKKLEPKSLWKHFYSLTQIPRVSKKEARVREFVKNFAEDLGLKTIVDEVGNLVVRKPAAPGMENRKIVCLQSHLDMVGQKNKDVFHDFEKDPIDAYIDDDWVTARGTTLGADNGIGAAAAMAVLESKDISHGPLEALFTIDEETGFTGAFGLKPDLLKADILINTDSEQEGWLHIGSAGGRSTIVTLRYTEEEIPSNHKAYEIRLTGLRGGHSGVDIHMGWGNAIKILNRFFCLASRRWDFYLASIDAGNLISAIPHEAFAVVTISAAETSDFARGVKQFDQTVKNEFSATEPDVKFEAVPTDMPDRAMDKEILGNLIKGICDCPNGVIRMSDSIEGLVDTSTNLGILKSEKGEINITTFQRSFDKFSMHDLGARIGLIFEWVGAEEVKHHFLFPAWVSETNSPILEKMQTVYTGLFGREPKIKMVHAGLECGAFKASHPHLDIISIGPSIFFSHTPDERVNIATVKEFWDFLTEVLKTIGEKKKKK